MAEAIIRKHSWIREPGDVLWAAWGLAAAALLVESSLECLFAGQSFWRTSWVTATVFTGPRTLHWPADIDFATITAALTAFYPTAFVLLAILGWAAERLSRNLLILAGALLGLAFFFVDAALVARCFPSALADRNWMMLAGWSVGGAVAAWFLKRLE